MKINIKIFGVITLFLISCSSTNYEDIANDILIELNITKQTSLDSIVIKVAQHFEVPGVAVAITDQDSIIDYVVYGSSNSRTNEPLSQESCFDINSISKSFSTLIIMQLVEEGLLTLDKYLVSIFPELKGSIHADYKDVTVRDFIKHQSGLSRNGRHISTSLRPSFEGTLKEKREQFTLWILRHKAETKKGEYSYSNAGFVVVGAVIERITGNSYENEIAERIFKPLGLKSAGFGWPVENTIESTYGHLRENGSVVPVRYADWYLYGIANPAGGIHMSITDISTYTREHLKGLSGKSKLLTIENFKLMHKIDGACGLGWYNSLLPSYPGSEVGGTDDGYRSEIFLPAQKDIGISILMNLNHRNEWLVGKAIELAILKRY